MITEVQHMYPKNVNGVVFNLLDSHDTPRILTLVEGNPERVKLMYLFQFTFTGTPCIYYGDEIGMDGGQDPGCRACMIWDEEKQDHDIFQFLQMLISFRKSDPLVGNDSAFRFLCTNDNMQTVVYEKSSKEKRLIFMVNNSDSVVEMNVEEVLGTSKGKFNELILAEVDPIRNQLIIETLNIAPYGFKILEQVTEVQR